MTALRAIEPSRLDELAQQINAEHEQVWRGDALEVIGLVIGNG